MGASKNLCDYIADVQERDNLKAMTDDELSRLKEIVEDEQVRRRVVATIFNIANSLK